MKVAERNRATTAMNINPPAIGAADKSAKRFLHFLSGNEGTINPGCDSLPVCST
jgi:hypothetical protein